MTLRQEIAAAFGCGAVVGGVVGYFVAEQRLRTKYNQIADDEIEHMKDFYREKEMELLEQQKKIADQPKPDLDEIADRVAAREREIAAVQEVAAEEGYVEEVNAFPVLPPWDYDREMAARTGEHPFIMHFEEYQQSECSHQITITYFEGDDVLVDESDEVISKKDEVVGMDNLSKFGHGSNDPNVLYVRNPKLDIEYEILLDKGHYAKEVLGLEEDTELEHSAIPRRRMKFDDDG